MNFDQISLKEQIGQLEQIELNNQDDTSQEVYMKLLIFYILDDDTMKAKFLWKRIPSALKDPNTELSKLWPIVQNFILRNYPLGFQLANQLTNFSNDELRNLFSFFTERMRERIFNLVQIAYSSIRIKDLANLLQVGEEKIVKISLQSEWTVDESKIHVKPKKLPSDEIQPINHQQQLTKLTKIVSSIET